MRSLAIIWRIVTWSVLVSYFLSAVVVAMAMPRHEAGNHQENGNPRGDVSSGFRDEGLPVQIEELNPSNEDAGELSSVADNGGTTVGSDPLKTEHTETTGQTASETESTHTSTTGGGEQTVNTTTKAVEFFPNEITRPSTSDRKQQQEVENVVEDAGASGDEFPLNSITPTIAALPSPTSLPLLPPPPEEPVIDPISFQSNDDSATSSDDNGVSSTSTTFFADSLPIIVPGASSPSIQLIPPPQTTPSPPPLSPDVPREPDQGELPESPEPHSQHPYNLHDIPISLLSLSGNSGGSTSDMATFSSLASPTENVPVDFTRYRYHVVTGQLFKIGSTGPGICPDNMRFFAVPEHPKNGACDCDYYQCSRPLIYSPTTHQCYWAWSQGPCEKGEWLVFNKDLRRRGECEKNPCLSTSTSSLSSASSSNNDTASDPTNLSSEEYFFQNPEDKACYQAGTQGYCGDADERLLIYPGEPIPKCRKFTLCHPLTVPQELQCLYGNKYFVESGHCQ